jgi:hypothetical protein
LCREVVIQLPVLQCEEHLESTVMTPMEQMEQMQVHLGVRQQREHPLCEFFLRRQFPLPVKDQRHSPQQVCARWELHMNHQEQMNL